MNAAFPNRWLPGIVALAAPAVVLAPLLACGPFFFQAPPPLSEYPQRFAGKTWQDFLGEDAPIAEDALSAAAMREAIAARIGEWLAGDLESSRVRQIAEEMLAANRNGHYRAHFANLLHEWIEIAGHSTPDEARAYLAWRGETLDESAPVAVSRPANEESARAWDHEGTARSLFFETALAETTPAMRPHWLVNRAAWRLNRRELDAAGEDTAVVLEEFPDTGRGEVALLLAGRVDLERARQLRRAAAPAWQRLPDSPDVVDAARRAGSHFRDYEERWPKGRFLADAIGWKGAVFRDEGSFAAAVFEHIRQLEAQPTREVRRAVYRECDALFREVMLDEIDGFERWCIQLPVDEIARHPALSLLLVYHCLDPEARTHFSGHSYENYESDAGILRFLERRVVAPRRAARTILNSLAAAVAGTPAIGHDPRALLVLAWVASEQGEPARARALLDRLPSAAAARDDALDLRVHVERLAGEPDAALAALDQLRDLHPESPLAAGVTWRAAEAHRQAGRHADAARALWEIEKRNRAPWNRTEAENPHPDLISGYQVSQMLDAIFQFAPLDELLPLCADDDPELAGIARRILRGRAFAVGDFDLAMSDGMLDPAPDVPGRLHGEDQPPPYGYLDRDSADRRAGPVRAAMRASDAAAPGEQRAAALLDLAHAWWQARGFLSLPSAGLLYPGNSEGEKSETRQRRNAHFLGFDDAATRSELDRRDEAWHALHASLAAAAEHPPSAAPALALANECLFRLAESSIYRGHRVHETGTAALSRQLVDLLRRDHPGHPATAAAVAWTFPLVPESAPWMPGDTAPWIAALQIQASVGTSDQDDLIIWQYQNPAWARDMKDHLREIGSRIATHTLSREEAAQRIGDLRTSLLPEYDSLDEAWLLNHIDDLAAVVSSGRGTVEELAAYFSLRLGGEIPDAARPEWESLRDFARFLEIIRRPGLESPEAWDAYLLAHPDTPKAEAADFRRIRILCRSQRGPARVVVEHWPRSIIQAGGKTVEIPRPDGATADAQSLLVAIARHREHFQPARYTRDLDLLEAGARADTGEITRALDLIAGVLNDPAARDLHLDASLLLAAHGLALVHPETRAPALAAFLQSQPARDLLLRMIQSETLLARLRPMLQELQSHTK